MATRILPDGDKASVSVELSLEKPLPDYDIEQTDYPTPREVDGVLVSQGFRDLVDDARGVLLELLNEPERAPDADDEFTDLDLTPAPRHPLEIAQLTGAIVSGEDEVYRPGLWIVLEDRHAPKQAPADSTVNRVKRIAGKLVERMDLA